MTKKKKKHLLKGTKNNKKWRSNFLSFFKIFFYTHLFFLRFFLFLIYPLISFYSSPFATKQALRVVSIRNNFDAPFQDGST